MDSYETIIHNPSNLERWLSNFLMYDPLGESVQVTKDGTDPYAYHEHGGKLIKLEVLKVGIGTLVRLHHAIYPNDYNSDRDLLKRTLLTYELFAIRLFEGLHKLYNSEIPPGVVKFIFMQKKLLEASLSKPLYIYKVAINRSAEFTQWLEFNKPFNWLARNNPKKAEPLREVCKLEYVEISGELLFTAYPPVVEGIQRNFEQEKVLLRLEALLYARNLFEDLAKRFNTSTPENIEIDMEATVIELAKLQGRDSHELLVHFVPKKYSAELELPPFYLYNIEINELDGFIDRIMVDHFNDYLQSKQLSFGALPFRIVQFEDKEVIRIQAYKIGKQLEIRLKWSIPYRCKDGSQNRFFSFPEILAEQIKAAFGVDIGYSSIHHVINGFDARGLTLEEQIGNEGLSVPLPLSDGLKNIEPYGVQILRVRQNMGGQPSIERKIRGYITKKLKEAGLLNQAKIAEIFNLSASTISLDVKLWKNVTDSEEQQLVIAMARKSQLLELLPEDLIQFLRN